jgi:hypothetical protein
MSDSPYDSWQKFLEKLLLEMKARGISTDPWVAGIGVAFGHTVFKSLAGTSGLALSRAFAGGIAMSIGRAGIAASLPFAPVVGGIALGALITSKYLNKAKTKQGVEISEMLRTAEGMYKEILLSDLPDDNKKRAIDRLQKDLLEGNQIVY